MTEQIRTVPTTTHWGTYLARTNGSRLLALDPHPDDPDPTRIGESVADASSGVGRLRTPLVRRGWLEDGPGPADRPGSRRRGDDEYVAVDWDTAASLVADEITRVRAQHGNRAIYGGSYGWGSAGRFHHPQSQVHRFLNLAGGYTRSVDTYSSAAITVILRRVAGGWQTAMDSTPTFEEIAEHGSLVVAFGGLALRNTQVNDGGLGAHLSPGAQRTAARAGVDFVSVSPLRTDAAEFLNATWLPARPGTDVAIMLGLAHEIVAAGRHDQDFLARCTTGWDVFEDYLMGRSDGVAKTAGWAAAISGIDADTLRTLAVRIATERTVISTSYSVQRADHGEQAPWMALTLAALSGSMGRPGGGFGCGLGALHRNGMRLNRVPAASFPQGVNGVADFIPVARISDLLTRPGREFDYDGGRYTYPDIRLVYWVGGNPFHHHQDLNRLAAAWQRPDTVIVHEHFANALARHADIVLPAATFAERTDFAAGREDPFLMAMVAASPPPGDVLTDYEIFARIAEKLGLEEKFTENRTAAEWVDELYERTRKRAATLDVQLPEWAELVERGRVRLPDLDRPEKPYAALRANPEAHPVATPSGRLEIYSTTIAGFGYADCPPHPTWLEPSEWLGSPLAQRFPLALVSGQPERRLHSQFDNGAYSRAGKINGREPVLINPADAAVRGIADGCVVRLFNNRGACLAGAVLSADIRPGVVRLSTGAWYDPLTPGGLDVHGNPNVLTPDHGTSALAQGPSAHTALVQVELWSGPVPDITVFGPMPGPPDRSAQPSSGGPE
ncbi:biotin/methionine sulfoxide reductase [Nakamurella panacisegetis]|uniref:Biotin/methionine sulfoxide reductase n=1 Tax=Nakamurella panacisegetis TaxID=1090615 RepID=A0A1H0HWN6_9ACTN|nr:molybdopterin-dependent oxidoreductase [Nakamurella panacisegetis]SDO23330.1 biotin/methionine sulfoxide reductase [Nakamurella panacisegetis]